MIKILIFLHLYYSSNAAVPTEEQREYFLNRITSDNQKMKTIFQDENMQSRFTQCYDIQTKSEKDANAMIKCLWDGDASAGIKALDDKTKAQLDEYLAEEDEDQEKGNDFRYRKMDGLTRDQSRTYYALREFYATRLEEALYGEKKSGIQTPNRIAEQEIFFDLQKTQLGKNIVATMTSYCVDAKHDKYKSTYLSLIDKDKITQNRKNNLNKLGKSDTLKNGKTTNMAYSEWSHCIQNIQHICYQMPIKTYDQEGNERPYSNDDFTNSKIKSFCTTNIFKDNESECENLISYSKQRACEVTNYVESARTNLNSIDKIKSKYTQVMGPKTGRAIGVQFYKGTKEQGSIDKLTSITSKDIADVNNHHSFAMANKQELDEFRNCYDTDENGQPRIIDAKACEKYLNTDNSEAIKAIVDMNRQTEKRANLLSTYIDNGDQQAAIAILENDGYTTEEATSIVDRYKEDPKEIMEIVEARYKTRMDAIQAKLVEDIQKISVPEISIETAGAKLQDIENDLKKKTKDFAQLVHFNNIVSSYLQVADGDNVSQNISSAKRELENNIFAEASRDDLNTINSELAGKDGLTTIDNYATNQDGQVIYDTETNVTETLDIGAANEESNAVLNVSDINKAILNFFKQEDEKTDKP